MILHYGFDAARYQGITNAAWDRISAWQVTTPARRAFAIIKATQDDDFTSPTYVDYFGDARREKILVGTYHFAEVGAANAVAQARYYVSRLRQVGWRSGFDLPPVLDIETGSGLSKAALTDWCLDFVNEVDHQLGLTQPWLKCGVYMNRNYHDGELDGDRLIEGRWWWLASWPDVVDRKWPTDAQRNQYATGAAIWQFTDNGIGMVPGVTGEGLDLNVARDVDLRSLAPSFFGTTPPVEDDVVTSAEMNEIAKRSAAAVWNMVLTAPESARRQALWPEGFKAPAMNYLIGNDAGEVLLIEKAKQEELRDQAEVARDQVLLNVVNAIRTAVASINLELTDEQLERMGEVFVRELLGEVTAPEPPPEPEA